MGILEFIMYKNLFGGSGGSAVDDGFCIKQTVDISGVDVVDLSHLGAGKCYKVSSLVLDRNQLVRSTLFSYINGELIGNDVSEEQVVSDKEWACVFGHEKVYVMTGKAGTFQMYGIEFTIPSNGTYFLYEPESITDLLCKPSA